jgi:hypothetical protein
MQFAFVHGDDECEIHAAKVDADTLAFQRGEVRCGFRIERERTIQRAFEHATEANEQGIGLARGVGHAAILSVLAFL